MVERARTLLQAQYGGMYLYDPARQELENVVATDPSIPTSVRVQLGEGMAGRVAQSHQPLIVDDYRTWEGRSPQYEGIPISATVGVPMLHGGELVGVLLVHETGDSSHKFNEEDGHLLSLFAGQAASAVYNARLLDETRRRLAEVEALHTVSAALHTAQTHDEALPILLDETLAVLETDAGIIWFYYPDSDELRAAVARGWFRQMEEAPMKPGDGIAGTVFASGQAHVSTEFRTDPIIARATTSEQIPDGWGGACVPIRSGAITVGVLFVSVPLPRQIAPGQVKLLESLAEMAGASLHRMSLYEATVRQLDHLQALHRIDQAIAASMDLRMTLNILLEHVLSQLKVDAASVLLLNPHMQTLDYAAGHGFRTEALQRTHLRLGEGYAGGAPRWNGNSFSSQTCAEERPIFYVRPTFRLRALWPITACRSSPKGR